MKTQPNKAIRINHWLVNTETGELFHLLAEKISDERIDPIGIQLLLTLAENNGGLVTKDTLLSTLWPDTVVTDEALSRCVSRLRKLLGDDPRQPEFIETLPKRGYRLVVSELEWLSSTATDNVPLAPKKPIREKLLPLAAGIILLSAVFAAFLLVDAPEQTQDQVMTDRVTSLVQEGKRYYHKVSRRDNEMALELYQQALAFNPRSAEANAGMANALVQRAIRMPDDEQNANWQSYSLSSALSTGKLSSKQATSYLNKAYSFSQKAIELAPDSAAAHKAHGFVLSAQDKLDVALLSYQTALSINPDAWDVLINMGEIYEITGRQTDAIEFYKKALNAMSINSPDNENFGRAWRANLGNSIGDKYVNQGNLNEAELWYRHVLSFAPFDTLATERLAEILLQTGRTNESRRLCHTYEDRIGKAICNIDDPD